MTSQEVVRLHTDGFSRALQPHDFSALEAIYSDLLYAGSPDGSVLSGFSIRLS